MPGPEEQCKLIKTERKKDCYFPGEWINFSVTAHWWVGRGLANGAAQGDGWWAQDFIKQVNGPGTHCFPQGASHSLDLPNEHLCGYYPAKKMSVRTKCLWVEVGGKKGLKPSAWPPEPLYQPPSSQRNQQLTSKEKELGEEHRHLSSGSFWPSTSSVLS